MGRNPGHPWGETVATSGAIQWPPMGSFPWPPSCVRGAAWADLRRALRDRWPGFNALADRQPHRLAAQHESTNADAFGTHPYLQARELAPGGRLLVRVAGEWQSKETRHQAQADPGQSPQATPRELQRDRIQRRGHDDRLKRSAARALNRRAAVRGFVTAYGHARERAQIPRRRRADWCSDRQQSGLASAGCRQDGRSSLLLVAPSSSDPLPRPSRRIWFSSSSRQLRMFAPMTARFASASLSWPEGSRLLATRITRHVRRQTQTGSPAGRQSRQRTCASSWNPWSTRTSRWTRSTTTSCGTWLREAGRNPLAAASSG